MASPPSRGSRPSGCGPNKQPPPPGFSPPKLASNAASYVAAALTMPSPVEIALATAAQVAAHSTGGVLNGTSEAAEAYKRSLDIRAALVMEAYEGATSATLATPPVSFQYAAAHLHWYRLRCGSW